MYTVEYDEEEQPLRAVAHVQDKIKKKIEWLGKNAESIQHDPLIGELQGFYKLVWGAFRIVYTIDHNSKKIMIHRIGPRGSIYPKTR